MQFEKWIKTPKEIETPLITKTIEIKDSLINANLIICGLGLYELFINGVRVDESFYKPTVSDYFERDFTITNPKVKEKTSHRIYYNSFDVKKFLKIGKNKIEILLGNGFLRENKRKYINWFSDNLYATFKLSLIYKNFNEIIEPDGFETLTNSFILQNNTFYGEVHDYNAVIKEYPYEIVSLPQTIYLEEDCPRDVVIKKIKPKLIHEHENEYLYDCGKNYSAFVSFISRNPYVEINYSEEIKNDYSLDQESCSDVDEIGEQVVKHIYKNAPTGKRCFPYFSLTSFRYFTSNVKLDDPIVNIIHSDVPVIGKFKTNNSLFNWEVEAFLRSLLNNFHYSYPSDCPHRERLGYTGDGQASSIPAMMLLDGRKFYKKWIEDILDCQDVDSGHVQHTAPFFEAGGGPGGWGGAIIIVPYNYYLIYKDKNILNRCFSGMNRYIEFMMTTLENGLVAKERNWGWFLGDWVTPQPIRIKEDYVNSCYLLICLKMFKNICHILREEYKYQELEQIVKKALKTKYFDKKTGNYLENVDDANAFAIQAGIGNKKTIDQFLETYRRNPHFNCGFLGVNLASQILVKEDPKLLLKILKQIDYPSFGYWREKGATTFYEEWNGKGSHCHHMFGGFISSLIFSLVSKDNKGKTLIKNADLKYIYNGYINEIKIRNYEIISHKKTKFK